MIGRLLSAQLLLALAECAGKEGNQVGLVLAEREGDVDPTCRAGTPDQGR